MVTLGPGMDQERKKELSKKGYSVCITRHFSSLINFSTSYIPECPHQPTRLHIVLAQKIIRTSTSKIETISSSKIVCVHLQGYTVP
jgi:hypothetical protein